MGLRYFIIWLILINCSFCFSQEDSLDQSQYIVKFPKKITTRISLINTSNSFYINDKNQGIQYKFEPNKTDYIGASILFRSLELDIEFAPDFLYLNKDNKDSKLFNLNFRMFLKQWMQTIDLYSQKGFYLVENNSRTIFPELSTFKIGGSTSYIFNKNFSFRAIGFQNEWQTKSAGSFIPRLFFYYTKFSLNEEGFENNSRSYDIAVSPSYHYNFVLNKNFIFSLGVSTGIGMNHNVTSNSELTSVLYEFMARGVVGYNSERFFGGINTNFLFLEHNTDRYTRLDDEISFIEFYIGYRFNAPKSWVKKADQFNSKFGL